MRETLVGRENRSTNERVAGRTGVRRGELPADRRTRQKIAHAMAKLQTAARLVREGHAELAAVFRAAKERARVAQEPRITQESSLVAVWQADGVEGRL